MTTNEEREIRQDVTEVLFRYAAGIDGRDWDLFRTCFTEECEADYGAIGVWHGAEEITAWMRDTHAPVGPTMHRITNPVVTPGAERATARCYVDALVMFADNTSGTRSVGYYDDELVPTDGGWKIARRRFTMVLLQLVPDGTVLDLETAADHQPGAGE